MLYQARLYEERVGWLFFEVPDGEDPQTYLDENIDILWNNVSKWNIKDCDYEMWGRVKNE